MSNQNKDLEAWRAALFGERNDDEPSPDRPLVVPREGSNPEPPDAIGEDVRYWLSDLFGVDPQ